MSLARASLSDLDAVHEILQDPLTGRNVMVPFTSKAFFAGTLQPDIMEHDGNQERVTVKLSQDTLVDMSRSEALELFEKRMQSFPKDIEEVRRVKIKNKQPSTAAMATQSVAPVGFFEIREEYDDHGKEIRAEAINVAKELEFLEKTEETDVSELLYRPMEWNADGDTSATNTSSNNDETDIDSNNTKPLITDSDFYKLSQRLEELARLEEETEANKAVNQKSAKTLQGSGWAKGFLNRPPSKRSTKIAGDPAVPAPSNDDTPRTKHVKFGATDVREIPRVGKSAQTPPTSQPPRQSISNEVFTGVVAERPVVTVHDAATVNVADTPPATERKLSRFAQQRLEQRER